MYTRKRNKKTSYVIIFCLALLHIDPLFAAHGDEVHGEDSSSSSVIIDNVTDQVPSTKIMADVPVDVERVIIPLEELVPKAVEEVVSDNSSLGAVVNDKDLPPLAPNTLDNVSTSSHNDVTLKIREEKLATTTEEVHKEFTSSTTFGLATTTVVDNLLSGGNRDRAGVVVFGEEGETKEEGPLPTGTTTITTGDTIAIASVLNIVNTNLVNSTGSIIMANIIKEHTGALDLRNALGTTFGTTCSLLICNGVESITASINADASIENVVAVIATSGGNEIATTEKAVIVTGDAYAGLNLINIANTNFVDSNYYLLSLNTFNNFNGDMILPSLHSLNSFSAGTVNYDAEQSSLITNDVGVLANTGDNQVEEGNGSIESGSSRAVTNIFNTVNSSFIGGSSLRLLLKISGTWFGNFIGIGEDYSLVSEGDTRVIALYNDKSNQSNLYTSSKVSSTSTASITNRVNVLAESGDNLVKDTHTSRIKTGDSYASLNIINIANTTSIGHTWMLGIINIFGDLRGDIVFGEADISLSGTVSPETEVTNGTELMYSIRVVNVGDRPGTNIVVDSTYDEVHLTSISSLSPHHVEEGKITFTIGRLVPGEIKDIIFYGTVHKASSGTEINNTSVVYGDETDYHMNNNTVEVVTRVLLEVGTVSSTSGGGVNGGGATIQTVGIPTNSSSTIDIFEKESISVVRVSKRVTLLGKDVTFDEVLVLHNQTRKTLHGVRFDDIIYNSLGNIVQVETFDLGDILPDEEITLTYAVFMGQQKNPEIFSLSSELHYDTSRVIIYSSNGLIVYSGFDEVTHEEEISASSSAPLNVSFYQKSSTLIKSSDKVTALSKVTDSLASDVVYASVSGESSALAKKGVSLSLIIFFILFSIHYLNHWLRRLFNTKINT